MNNILEYSILKENIQEILLSKFIFQKVLKKYRLMRQAYDEEGTRLFYFKYKNVIHKFRMFLYELDLKGELTTENLKLNMNKIREKLLSEKGYQKIIERINNIALLTRSFIPELILMMC